MTDQLTQQQREALEAVCKLEAWTETRVGAGKTDDWASAARTYILNSTPVPDGWQLVPSEVVMHIENAYLGPKINEHNRDMGGLGDFPDQSHVYREAEAAYRVLAAAPTPEASHD